MRVRSAWRRLFSGTGTKADADLCWTFLVDYCRDEETTAVADDPNAHRMHQLEGRRQVLLMLRKALRMSEAESGKRVEGATRTLDRRHQA